MKRDYLEKILKRAKTKKDGVYSYERILYKVKNNAVTFLSDVDGTMYQFCYGFLINVGETEYYIDTRRKAIKKI